MTPRFGLSLRSADGAIPALPKFCRMLELPGEVLDGSSVREWSRECAAKGIEWGVRDLLDSGLARKLADERDTLLIEAFRKLEARAKTATAYGAKWASLDLDAERASRDAEYGRAVRRVLLQIGGILAKPGRRIPLLLPVRIPVPGGGADPEKLLAFRHALPLAGMRLVFELHPHEPGALEWGGRGILRFEARWWRVCFDPASGNKLSSAALSRFLDFGPEAPEAMRVFFSPEPVGSDDFVLNQLSDTVEKWETAK